MENPRKSATEFAASEPTCVWGGLASGKGNGGCALLPWLMVYVRTTTVSNVKYHSFVRFVASTTRTFLQNRGRSEGSAW